MVYDVEPDLVEHYEPHPALCNKWEIKANPLEFNRNQELREKWNYFLSITHWEC